MLKKDTNRLDIGRDTLKKVLGSDLIQDLNKTDESAFYPADKSIEKIDLEKLFPAPRKWNFWPSISEGKMLEMMLSIQVNGLFNPIILWEKENKYMILSGHNRVEAYRRILKEYGDTDGFNPDEFKRISAIIYKGEEIDESKAREIVVDTNYLQREEDKRLMPLIVKSRIEIIRDRKDKKGRTIDIAAKELGLSRTKVYEDYIIGEKIIPELSEMFFDGNLTKKALLKFASHNKKLQEYLYDKHKENITNEASMKIKKDMQRDEISMLFEKGHVEKIITMQVRVPESLKDDFREMANTWLQERRK